jgi:hypothetical protein
VFQSGKAKLSEAVAIQTEISFVPLYKDQPTLGDIDLELRGQGSFRIASPRSSCGR